MDQTVNQTSQTSSASIYTHTPFVEVTKVINAPIEHVWQAWSDPRVMKEWWGPEGFTCPELLSDFRIDGKYLAAMKSPEGQVTWSTGIYKEILPHELIVCTDQFSDENGNPISPKEAGMEGDWETDTCLFSVKFETLSENKTKIQLVHEGIPASMHDDCVDGWNSSLEKMKRIAEKN